MVKKMITILVILLLSVNVFAEEIKNDIFQVKGSQKSAAKAMLFSAIIPGIGQFYSNPHSITAYIFPVLEFGLWYGYFYYQNEGDDMTKQYQEFADEHYSRIDQWQCQRDLIIKSGNNTFYSVEEIMDNTSLGLISVDKIVKDEWNGSGGHFNLDHEDTQHFYEDIGKYDKYLYGWKDWYNIYAMQYDDNGNFFNPGWVFDEYNKLEKVNVKNPESEYYDENLYKETTNGFFSEMRATYLDMRWETEDNYDKKRYCTFGLLFNHLLATLDAVRVTKKYNIEHLSQNPVDFKFATGNNNGAIQPALFLSYKF